MRHAKSSWDNLLLEDHDRPLNERGLRNCKDVAAELVNQSLVPDHVVSSTAARCVETWEHLGLTAGFDAPVKYDRNLYHASAEKMLDALKEFQSETVLMIGHNPGIADFAEKLIGGAKPDHSDFGRYPTASVSVFRFDKDAFSDVSFGSGTCERFFVPRDLGTK